MGGVRDVTGAEIAPLLAGTAVSQGPSGVHGSQMLASIQTRRSSDFVRLRHPHWADALETLKGRIPRGGLSGVLHTHPLPQKPPTKTRPEHRTRVWPTPLDQGRQIGRCEDLPRVGKARPTATHGTRPSSPTFPGPTPPTAVEKSLDPLEGFDMYSVPQVPARQGSPSRYSLLGDKVAATGRHCSRYLLDDCPSQAQEQQHQHEKGKA